MPFSEMLDWLLSRRKAKDGCVRYVQSQNGNLSGEFELLRNDVSELDWATDCFGEKPDASNIWIGNEESTTSVHLDHYENLYCQVTGSKTFYLIPPTEYACLQERRFPSARWKPSIRDPTHLELEPLDSTTPWLTVDPSSITSDDLSSLTRLCRPIVITLQPGQVLYLPALWFHSVFQSPDPHGLCIAVNFWYDMDYTGPLYPLYNFLRHTTMLHDGRTNEIQTDAE